jgi:putative transcriptional regulator
MPIVVRIDVELARRKMSVMQFADEVGLTPANVAVLKNGRAKAVRFSTLEAMCRVLQCQPGDLLEYVDDSAAAPAAAARRATAGMNPADAAS